MSCSDDKDEVRQFAINFAEMVSKNQVDSIRALYPGTEKIDSFALNFNPDSVKVEETETAGTFILHLSPDATATAVKGEDGKMTIQDSRGLSAYQESKMSLAKATGWFDGSLNDAQNAERLADEQFVEYCERIIMEGVKSKVRIAKSVCTDYDWDNFQGICLVVVSNQSERQIEGNEYVVTARLYDQSGGRAFGSREYCGSRNLTGKPIPANGQVSYSFRYNVGGYPTDPVCTISVNPKSNNALKDYNFKGDEYKKYLESKNL